MVDSIIKQDEFAYSLQGTALGEGCWSMRPSYDTSRVQNTAGQPFTGANIQLNPVTLIQILTTI